MGARRPARRGLLRPAPADPPGPGRRRHQVVPVPRPGPPPGPGLVDVGPQRGPGHGAAPEHRLPLAHGALLLGRRDPRPARLAGPAPVARVDPLPGRAGRALPAAEPGPVRSGRDRGHVPLRPVALRAHPGRAHLGPAAPVHRPRLDAGAHRAGHPRADVGAPGPLRPRRPHLRLHQRHRAAAGGHRARAVDPLRHLRAARDPPAGGAGGHRPHRRADPRGVAVVDRRALGPGQLRHRRPALHRDGQDGGRRLVGPGAPAGARLLVLLRRRQAGTLDRALGRLHPEPGPDRRHLRAAGHRPAQRGRRPVAVPVLLRQPGGHRAGRLGRRPPVGPPRAAGRGVQGLPPVPGRPGHAEPAPGRAPREPGLRGPHRHGRHRPGRAGPPPGAARGRGPRRAGPPGPAPAVARPDGGRQPAAPRGGARVLDRGRLRDRRPRPAARRGLRQPHPRGAGLGLRLLPLG